MDLHTRCNGCGKPVRAFIPWYISIPWLSAPVILLVIYANHVPQVSAPLIFAMLLWEFAAIPLGYIWFGKVVFDD